MPQGVSAHFPAHGRGPARVGVRSGVPRFGFVLAALLLLSSAASHLSAQSRSSVQVAAQVLPVEPSRTALGVAVQALDAPSAPESAHSRLAAIRIERTGDAPGGARRRRLVRIDFLRN
jgi:hypothetical protein